MARELIFVSSVQKELADERRALAAFVRGHPLLQRFFDVFLFEELPATDRRAGDLYLEKVDEAGVYVGLFGREYGIEDAEGLAATEREFDRATQRGKPRLVFVKGGAGETRHPRLQALIRRAEAQLVRRRFEAIPDLEGALFASLVQRLADTGRVQERPFDAAACPGASIRDLSAEKVAWFLRRARDERRLSLPPRVSVTAALTHLNLLDGDRPTRAAVLLFGKDPQRFAPAAELKCLHFHGIEVRKPIPSYKLFKGTLFDQVDQAVDFVLSKLDRQVGTRERGPAAPAAYEIPPEVVTEAVVNAVAHRDYASNAAVQVHVFSDRVEVWNPGALPPELTPERLRHEHPSIPRNPLIADALYRARYIEKAGTGTLDMIARCGEAGLPEPDFEQRGGQFVVTCWRDWLTTGALARLVLNERQKRALGHLRMVGRLTNADYQRVTGSTRKTAARDLDGLVAQGALERIGAVGRGAYYVVARKGDSGGTKWDMNGTNGTSDDSRPKRATEGPKGPSRPEPGKRRRRVTRAGTRQKPDKPVTSSPPRRPSRGKTPKPRRKRLAKRSMGSSLRGPHKRDKNGTNGT